MPSAPFITRAMSAARRVQYRMPTRSIVSPLMTTRVRASFSICTPRAASAAGMSRSSSWLPRMPKTPYGAESGVSASAAGVT